MPWRRNEEECEWERLLTVLTHHIILSLLPGFLSVFRNSLCPHLTLYFLSFMLAPNLGSSSCFRCPSAAITGVQATQMAFPERHSAFLGCCLSLGLKDCRAFLSSLYPSHPKVLAVSEPTTYGALPDTRSPPLVWMTALLSPST